MTTEIKPSTLKPLKVSFVISAYNEEGNVTELFRCLRSHEKPDLEYEYIYVNDGSSDVTALRIKELAVAYQDVKLISFSRNFGHEVAMVAGLDFATGDAVIFMDADLQHPPEISAVFIDYWLSGKKLVLSRRANNPQRGVMYQWFSRFFYYILGLLSECDLKANYPDFRLVDRKYADYLKKFREPAAMFRGFIGWIQNEEELELVEFEVPPRLSGDSKYNFRRLFKLAIDATFSFSLKPLRLAMMISASGLTVSVILGLYLLIPYLLYGKEVEGFLTIAFTVLFLGNIQLMVMSILGEYIGRIHMQVKNRPLYVIKEVINDLPQD